MNIRQLLNFEVRRAMSAAGVPEQFGANLTPSKKPGFGDYQANGAMAAAKHMQCKPRDLAQTIVAHLSLAHIAQKIEIAGPGFINIHLSTTWLAQRLCAAAGPKGLAIDPSEIEPNGQQTQTIVVDYSSPNLAKEMHVGHLRSTIIGDALVRVLEFLGHRVIRQNHVGDWGTQFGMLITELQEQLGEGGKASLALKDLEAFYQQAKRHFDNNEDFASKARSSVVKLQGGDPETLKLWQQFLEVSLQHSEEIYQRLNVTLCREHVYGESNYNDDLPVLVKELQERRLVVENQGAQVAFLPELADKEGKPSAVIVQKQDGGYLYATTDLAAIRYRVKQLKATRLMYFIDARQSLHMQQMHALALKAGFIDKNVSFEHHPFGTMMGSDGKPFKTRSGEVVKLAELLNEAVQRAEDIIAQKASDLEPQERREVARKVGIGAIKYADLSKTRTHDYVFNWNSMLSFEGNTAPYLQYAYTRIQSIFRKANIDPENFYSTDRVNMQLKEEAERRLALATLQFNEVIEVLAREAYPHVLCNYLYDLASEFMSFYEACPILKEGVDETERNSRLILALVTARTLRQGLELLGIETMDRM